MAKGKSRRAASPSSHDGQAAVEDFKGGHHPEDTTRPASQKEPTRAAAAEPEEPEEE